uniref:Integrase catalytic domain-containing protein n=1 Tax=Paramormyrops kingsleyae TaxID=1676925 RepID=A0A3B3SR39_9TELE
MAHAFQCRDQSAKQVARQLWDRYFCVYGFPERIHSDQGANFESQLIGELMQIAGVKKSRTTAYHPMGNGQAERFNRTLGGMIRALPPRAKQKWPQMLQTLTFAYNCTAHESTGYAPFYLMFGRTPRLPVDIMFRNVERDDHHVDYDGYVKRMREDMKEALLAAQENVANSQRRQTDLYNRRTKGCDIEMGDQVLLANKGERGRRKLADKWESIPYIVVSKDPKCHVYHIRNTSSGHVKVVHWNLLLQANFLPLEAEAGDECSFISESEVSQVQSEEFEGTPSALNSPVDSATRTASWVAEVADTADCAGNPHTSSELEVSEPNFPSVNNTPCDDCASSEGQGIRNVSNSVPASSVVAECSVIPMNAEVMSPANAITKIRTRVGRMVKPVNRLIHNMTQKSA